MTSSDPSEVVESCPVCGGKMSVVYERFALKVCVCPDCFAGIYIPSEAWDVAKRKHARPAESSNPRSAP